MFSFLNFLSQGLNYFGFFSIGNRGNQVLNQVYIIVGVLGDLYLFYAGGRFITNGYLIHGVLILLASIALVYFLAINFYYYFLKRNAPFDFSPQIEKRLGLKQFNEVANHSLDHLQNLPEGGARRMNRQIRQSLPAHVTSDSQTQRNVRALVEDLIRGHHLTDDYAGLSHRQLIHRLKRNHHEPVYAIGAGALVPIHHLRWIDGSYRVFVGNDEAHERYVGKISRVGLQRIQDVNVHSRSWQLILTSVILVGGPYQVLGRSRVYRYHTPYHLQVNVQFRRK